MVRYWKHTSLLVLALALVVAIVAVSCAPTQAPAPGEEMLKVGVIAAFTGPLASITAPGSEGALGYLKYVNEGLGGIEYKDPTTGEVEKAKLDILWDEHSYNVARAISGYKRQKAAGAMLILVCGTTQSEALAELASRERIPLCTFTGGASPLIAKVKPQYTLMGFANYPDQGGAMLEAIKKDWAEARPPRVGFMLADTPAIRTMDEYLTMDNVAKFGCELAGKEWFPLAPIDTTIELTRLSEAKSDWIIVVHVPSGTAVCLKDAVRMGMKEEVKWALSIADWDDSLLTLTTGINEGIYILGATAAADEDVPGVKLAREFIRKYYNRDLSVGHLLGWAPAMAGCEGLRLALEKVGYEGLTRDAVREGLFGISNLDMGGIVPPVTVDPGYPQYNSSYRMCIIRGGKFVVLGEWTKCPEVSPRG